MLVRHARPVCDWHTWLRRAEFPAWLDAYDQAPLDPESRPPAPVLALAQRAALIVTSTLRRSHESAALLEAPCPTQRDALFDEVPMRAAPPVPFALRPAIWGALAHTAWGLGWSASAEGAAAARSRADRAARRLADLALLHGPVLLVGHGMLNSLIGRSLRRAHWQGPRPRYAHWSAQVFRSG